MDASSKNKIECPIALELTIPKNELIELMDKELSTDWLEASNIPDINYCIAIITNDIIHKHEGKAWIYFCIERPEGKKVEANVNIGIKSANYHDEQKLNFEKDDFIGKELCTTEELFDPENKYIVNGKMTLKMEGNLMIEEDEEENNTSWKCGDSVDTLCLALWEQEGTKDFKIVVGEKEIAAHKCVLAARSSVFAKMFASGMKEAQEGKVEINDFPFDIVKKAIQLCYHHSLVTHTSVDEKLNILQFFDKYDIQELKENLENCLVTVINETNVCRFTNAALISNALKLEEKCEEFLQDCLHERNPISDFDILDKDFAMNLLKSAFYPVPNYEIF